MTCLLLLGGCTTSNLDVETPSKIYTTEEISSLFQKVELTPIIFINTLVLVKH